MPGTDTRIWPCCLKAISIPTGPQSCPYSLQLDQLKAKLFQPFGHGFERLPVQPAGLWPVQVLKYAPLTPPAHCVQTPCAPPAPRASPPPPFLLDLTFALWPRLPRPPRSPAWGPCPDPPQRSRRPYPCTLGSFPLLSVMFSSRSTAFT